MDDPLWVNLTPHDITVISEVLIPLLVDDPLWVEQWSNELELEES